jgi:CRISPR-associated protein (TIGR02710 family)
MDFSFIDNRKKELKDLAKEDYEEIENLIEDFRNTISIEDKIKLTKISNKAFQIEKRYIPLIDENKKIAETYKCDTLIMTVGLQKEPVILSILCLKPHKKIFLLHTQNSLNVAQNIVDDPDIKDYINSKVNVICKEITETEATTNYKIIQEEILPYCEGNIIIDATAGRKIMVASLALLAFYFNIPLLYLHSIEIFGVTFPFSETLKHIENPFEYYGNIELKIVEEQFNSHFYKSAITTCDEILKKTKDLATYKKIELIKKLIEIYNDWDLFYHSSVPKKVPTLSERLEEIKNEFIKFGMKNYLPLNIDKNIEFLREIDSKWKDKLNIIDEYRIADIYVNALRRGTIKQGRYDDAIARLYRVLEMCSSYILLKHGIIDLATPNYSSLSEKINVNLDKIEEEFRKIKNRSLPQESLALDDQMTLLSIIGNLANLKDAEKVAGIYNSLKRSTPCSRSLMDKRNRSILAHGTDPLTEEDWINFRDKVKVIVQETIGKKLFSELCNPPNGKALHGRIKLS